MHPTPNSAYESVREARRAAVASRRQVDPATTAAAVLTIVDAPEPPLRIFLGTFPFPVAERVYQERLATWQQWRPVGEAAD